MTACRACGKALLCAACFKARAAGVLQRRAYVAGKSPDRARAVMRTLSDYAVFDWTTAEGENDPPSKAAHELTLIADCDVFVYLWEPDQECARYEAGAALMLGKRLVVSGCPSNAARRSFLAQPNVTHVTSDDLIRGVCCD